MVTSGDHSDGQNLAKHVFDTLVPDTNDLRREKSTTVKCGLMCQNYVVIVMIFIIVLLLLLLIFIERGILGDVVSSFNTMKNCTRIARL